MTTAKKIILSDENYYGGEADKQYMSVSQYKDFKKCEAMALAKLTGSYEPISDPTALLVGNYVHSYFEAPESHEKFISENKDKMFSSRKPYGLLKSFQIAEQMIKRLEDEPAFINLYQGEKESIITGELYGVEWKGKIDCLNVDDGYFVDIKTTKDIHERKWNDTYCQRVTFIENYGYVLQMVVYKTLLEMKYGREFTPIIAAVSKQTPSEAKLIMIDEDKMDFELRLLEDKIKHIQRVKTGQAEPKACGRCEYCRANERITEFTSMDEL